MFGLFSGALRRGAYRGGNNVNHVKSEIIH